MQGREDVFVIRIDVLPTPVAPRKGPDTTLSWPLRQRVALARRSGWIVGFEVIVGETNATGLVATGASDGWLDAQPVSTTM
jgi:hypothetical protein